MNHFPVKESLTDKSYTLESGDNIVEIHKIAGLSYEFGDFKIDNKSYLELSKAFAKKLFTYCRSNSIVLDTVDLDLDKEINKFLDENGFKIYYTKILFERDVKNFEFGYDDIFEYESITETGEDEFINIYSQVLTDDPEGMKDPLDHFNEIKEYLADKFNPKYCLVVKLKSKAIGVIIPQIFPDGEDWGGIMHIGLIPEERHKGYGRILQAKCFELLKKQGVIKYVGSTNINNKSMLRVFEINGCKKYCTRFFYIAE